MTKEEKHLMMTSAPVERLVIKLAVPTMTTMLISAMYNMADTYFVGRIGTSATAAVGISFALMAIIQSLGFFFGHGAGNFIARQLGARNNETAARMAATGAVSAWLCGALVVIAGLLTLEPLALLLGATETVLPYAKDYLRYILLGAPWMCCSLTLNNLLRFQGSAVYGMVGMVAGAVLNIALDPVFIFALGMGVSGAALATMISQIVSCGILIVGSSRGGNISLSLRNFSPSAKAYREITRGGLPSLLRQGLGSVAMVILNNTAGAYGDAAIAAMSVVFRVIMMSFSALLGFGQGFQPVCGFNYGAKLYGRVRRAFWFCVKVSVSVLVVLAVISYIFAPQIIAVFRRDDPEVIRIGTVALRASAAVLPLCGWVVCCNMMLQTIGKAFKASVLAVSRQGIFLIAYLMLLTPRLGILGIQIAQPLSDVSTFLLAIPMGLSVLGEMKRAQADDTPEPETPQDGDIPELTDIN